MGVSTKSPAAAARPTGELHERVHPSYQRHAHTHHNMRTNTYNMLSPSNTSTYYIFPPQTPHLCPKSIVKKAHMTLQNIYICGTIYCDTQQNAQTQNQLPCCLCLDLDLDLDAALGDKRPFFLDGIVVVLVALVARKVVLSALGEEGAIGAETCVRETLR